MFTAFLSAGWARAEVGRTQPSRYRNGPATRRAGSSGAAELAEVQRSGRRGDRHLLAEVAGVDRARVLALVHGPQRVGRAGRRDIERAAVGLGHDDDLLAVQRAGGDVVLDLGARGLADLVGQARDRELLERGGGGARQDDPLAG